MLQYCRTALFLAASLLAILLVGCGGGGSSASSRLLTSGTVILPSGSTLQPANLRVYGAQGVSGVAANGQFTLQEPTTGPALVSLNDTAGHPILFGYVDAKNASGGEISAKQTAVVLLFQAIGGYLLPPGEWKKLLELIAADAHTQALADVIATRVAANPTALPDGDAEVRNALATAAAALNPPHTTAADIRAIHGSTRVAVSRDTTSDVTKVAILTPGPQSGAEVQLNTDGSGIIIANGYRRHLIYYIYRTGYVDQSGSAHDVAPWVEFTHDYLTATSGVTSVVTAITDYTAGTVAYGDTTTQPINLPLVPADAKRTLYTVVVIGPGADMVIPPSLQSAPAALKQQWMSAASGMIALEWFKEFFLPGFFAVIPANGFAEQFTLNEANVKFALDVANMFSQGGLDVGTALASGDYKGVAVNAFKAVAGNESLRTALFTKIQSKMLAMGLTASAETVAASLEKVNVALGLVDKILTGGDIGATATQLAMSSVYTHWELAANKLAVKIIPDAATATTVATPITLTCQISGLSGGLLNYHWATTGKYGHLEDDRNHSGTAFDSTLNTVRYVPDIIDDGKSDQVTVEAYLVPEGGVGNKQDLGQGTAVITCQESHTYTINAFHVDDGAALTINGTPIYTDIDTASSGWRGPFTFEASSGDQLRLVVWDYYGYHTGIDQDISLTLSEGTQVKCFSSFSRSVPDYYYLGQPYRKTIQLDETFTIP